MIKLIASDMDGTLLNDRKELPGDFFEVFDELERRGIKFTVASGRSFDARSRAEKPHCEHRTGYCGQKAALTADGSEAL